MAFLSTVMTKLALMIALKNWRHYVLPLAFTVRTDHNRLLYLLTQSSLNNRQWRWLASLKEYQHDLEYRAGKNPLWTHQKPHTEGEQPSLRVKEEEQENTHMMIRVTTKDGAKKKKSF